jgi:diguanylate cyclase (GGDEF)-like protein
MSSEPADAKEEFLQFAEESPPSQRKQSGGRPWRILIVDDDEQVHMATELALADSVIQGRTLEFLHAYSAMEARRVLASSDNIAVIFLDVVMEKEDAGLKLVKVIREQLGLADVRIILRTGQPGYAPELEAIRDYDINDYRTKSELTRTRLVTSLTTAIRSYEQIRALAYSRQGLEKIIRAASDLFEKRALESMAEGVLTQIAGLLGFPPNGVVCAQRGFPLDGSAPEQLFVIGAVGRYAHAINHPLHDLGDPQIEDAIQSAIKRQQNLYTGEYTVLYLNSSGREEAIYLDSDKHLEPIDQQLLEVFAANISVGFANVYLFHRLNFLAYNDPVTGLPNRRRLVDIIDAMKRDAAQPFSVILADIDHFADINDVFGSSLGDLVLRSVAERLRSRVPAECHVGRFGGDTMCVVGVKSLLSPEPILKIFAEPFDVSGYLLPLSATIGECMSSAGRDGLEILKNAGLALTHAKQSTRGQAVCYSEHMTEQSRERLELMQALRIAVSERQLAVHYQPQIDLATGRVVGAEALLRWRREDGTMVPPGQFIPLAEHCGLIGEIGGWVMQEVCRQIAAWNDAGLPGLCIAINVSAQQMRGDCCVSLLEEALRANGVGGKQIELEITESLMMEDLAAAVTYLSRFKELGVGIAIDDFGTGFSSLSYLRQLPIDTLKVDRTFIRDIGQNGDGERIGEMIVALSKLLHLNTVAEGIETQRQAETARAWGCQIAQGFLYSPALDPAEFEQWVRTRPAPPRA